MAHSTLDLAALRHHRKRVAMSNYIARQRFELYAESYTKNSFYPPNSITNNPDFVKKDFVTNQVKVVKKLAARKVI